MSTTEMPATPKATDAMSSPRLEEFRTEVDQLKVTGGKANPERVWTILSGIGMVVGLAVTLIAYFTTHGTTFSAEWADYRALGIFGLALTVASTGVFTVMNLRRYFRYWLVRLIFEQRDQTDRIVGSR